MISKHLTDIGLTEDDIFYDTEGDKRQPQWKEQQKIYGFDERSTWNFSYTFATLVYPRLKMYDEINIIDTSFHKFEHNDEVLTMQECIDKILKGFEKYLTMDECDVSQEKEDNVLIEYRDCCVLLGKIILHLWW